MARLNAKAILFGVLVDLGATVGAAAIAGVVAAVLVTGDGGGLESSPTFVYVGITLGMAATLLGGFVAGRVAGAAHALHGAAVGLVGLILSLLIGADELPVWLVILVDALIIPVAVLGALLAKWGAAAPVPAGASVAAIPSPIERGTPASAFEAGVSEPPPMFLGKPEPRGLGGWLILIALGLIGTVIRVLAFLAMNLPETFGEGNWTALTDSESPAYHPLWGPLILFEIAGNLALAAAAVTGLVLFFRRSSAFPKLMMGILLGGVLFLAIDYFGARMIPAVAEQHDPEGLRELLRAAIGSAIWVPYLLRSRRVRNTFVRREEAAPTPILPQPIG